MARKQNLPLPASTRDNGQQSRTRSALAVGAMLCMAAAIGGTALAMRGSGTELASSQSPMTSYEQPNTHMRRDKIMDAMMGKINGLDIKANPNAAGANSGSDSGNHGKDGKPQDFKPKETQTEQEPPAPVVTDEHGDEVAQVETAQQIMADNDWTQADLDARLDPNNPLYDPILEAELKAPPPLKPFNISELASQEGISLSTSTSGSEPTAVVLPPVTNCTINGTLPNANSTVNGTDINANVTLNCTAPLKPSKDDGAVQLTAADTNSTTPAAANATSTSAPKASSKA